MTINTTEALLLMLVVLVLLPGVAISIGWIRQMRTKGRAPTMRSLVLSKPALFGVAGGAICAAVGLILVLAK